MKTQSARAVLAGRRIAEVRRKLAIALLFAAATTSSALADLVDDCRGDRWPDARLTACTQIIMDPGFDLYAKELAFRYRGEARNEAGAFAEAIADFSDAIRIKIDDASAYAGRGWARFSSNDLAGALRDYDEAIRLSPGSADFYIERGHVHLVTGNSDAAIRDLTDALRLDPASAAAYNNRGLAYRKKGNLDAALRDYDQAIAINPVYALAYANRGYAEEAGGQKAAAIEDLRHAVLLDPSLVTAREALTRLGGEPSVASESERRIREGHELVERNCSRCHAVGTQGRSPNPRAPEFRSLRHFYPLIALRKPITRAIAAPHDQMPAFGMSEAQIDMVVAYINSLPRK
jgi:tetratricopeptide (TPR) repeat protein